MKNAIRALALAPLLLLGGCFDYTEEVYVHRDGTGRLVTDVAFLSEMLAEDEVASLREALQQAARDLEAHPDVAKVVASDRVEGPKHHFALDIHAKRWQALPAIVQAEDWLTLEQLEGKQVRFSRALNEGSAAALALVGRGAPNVSFADDRARDLVARMMGRGRRAADQEPIDFHATFKLHAPKVVDSNGQASGGDVTWRWRLEELEEQAPPRLEARLDLSSRSFLLPLAAALGFGFGFLWLKKRWDKRYL